MANTSSSDRRGPKGQHQPSTNELGRVIQAARLARKLTTREVAELIGVTDASVTQTELGQTIPRIPTIKEYEKHLGVALLKIRAREVANRKVLKTSAKVIQLTKDKTNLNPAVQKTELPPIEELVEFYGDHEQEQTRRKRR